MEARPFPGNFEGLYDRTDRNNIYKLPFAGLFQGNLETGGILYSYLTYIPESARQSGPAVLAVPDAADTMEGCLERGGWREAADRYGFLVFAAPPGADWTVLRAMGKQMLNKTYHNVNKAYCYLAGYGSGGSAVQELAMHRPQDWAGAASLGEFDVSEEELAEISGMPSDLPFVPLAQVPMPVWLWTKKLTARQECVLEYWKKANRVEEEPYEKNGIRYYLPKRTGTDALINEQAGAQILLTISGGFGQRNGSADVPSASLLWDTFFRRTARYWGIANGNLRPVRTQEEWGFERKTMVVDGYRREWYQYIPEETEGSGRRFPLVVFFHGGSNIGLRALTQTDWIKIARERQIAVAFPGGTLRRLDQKGAIPHPAWNASGDDAVMDDVKFVRRMLETMIAEKNIDRRRIYASGHSMGAAMCQRALLALPEYFVAGGATGGLLKGGDLGSYDSPGVKENGKIPIWLILGENDIDRGGLENEDAKKNLAYWTKRNGSAAPGQPSGCRCGLYTHSFFPDPDGIPLVRFSVVDYRPHCSIPQDAWFFYDEFFCRFSRDEDGKLLYLGRPVK